MIKFNKNMIDELDGFNKSFDISSAFKFEIIQSRELEKLLEINGVEQKSYDLYLKFNSTFDSFKNDEMKVNITFEYPLIYKSGIYVKDYMKTTVLEPKIFNIQGQIPGTSMVSNDTREI